RHGTWFLQSTPDTREHRRELRKGRIDRGLLRARSVRARSDTRNSEVLRNEVTPWRRSTVADSDTLGTSAQVISKPLRGGATLAAGSRPAEGQLRVKERNRSRGRALRLTAQPRR